MFDVLIAAAFLLQPATASQDAVRMQTVWNISWRVVSDSTGRVSRVPVLAWGASEPPAAGIRYSAPPEMVVVAALEEKYRHAKLAKERGTLDRILSPDYYETDAAGNRRDKSEAISFALDARMSSFSDAQITARGRANAIVVTGEETVTSDAASSRTLFTHVYARDAGGELRLLSTTQVRSGR